MKTTNRIKWGLLLLFIMSSATWDLQADAQLFPRRGEEQFAPRRPFQPAEANEDESQGEDNLRRRRGMFAEGFEQRRQQRRQRIERARNMARLLLRDPNTPADIKAKAQQLDDLLEQREQLEAQLVGKRQEFLRTHRQEIDELRQLRERADVLRQNLRASREKAVAENLPKIQEMRRLTNEARQMAQELRQQFRGLRRGEGEVPADN